MLIQGWRRKDVSMIAPLLMRIIKKNASSNVQKDVVTSIIGESVARFLRRWLALNARGRNFTPQHTTVFEAEIARLDQQAEHRLTIYHPFPELQALRSTPMSLKSALRNMLQSLMDWGSTLMINQSQRPPNYTPRTLHIAIAVIGARAVLGIILEELKTHIRLPDTSGPMALDIFTTLICNPVLGSGNSPTDWMHTSSSTRNGRLTLREALKLEFEEAPKLLQSDQLLVECIVRLHRRVEAQLSMILTNIADLPAPLISDLNALADDAAGVDLAAVADAVDSMDFTTDGALTDSALGLAMDLDQTTAGAGMDLLGSGGGLGEEDIFADLMSGSLADMQFDGFD
jgi:mediator of RNA polymerase II transcription subunit 5